MDDPQVGWERAVGPVAAGLLTAAVLTIAGGIAAGLALGPHTVSGNFVVARDPGYWQMFLLAGPRAAMLVVATLTVWLATRAPQTDRDRTPADDRPVAIEML